MNREQREGYEQGETDHTDFCGFPMFRGLFPGTLPFSGKGSPLPGKKEVLPPLPTAHLEPPLIFLSQEVTMKRFQILSPGSIYHGGFERGRA